MSYGRGKIVVKVETSFKNPNVSGEFDYQQRKARQAEGIRKAKALGVRFGRPMVQVPPNFEQIVTEWENKRIPLKVALRLCGMSSATFFRRVKEYRQGGEK